MKISTWQQRHAIKIPAPRILISMSPSMRGRYSKATTGRTSARNKSEYLKESLASSMLIGRQKIMRLLDRGIRLTK